MGMLEEIKRLAENDLGDSFIESDRLGVGGNGRFGDRRGSGSF